MQTKLRNIMSSKKGFTLIELLVVIGILAVLAAIAIPSVAGLIDRANVSADATNANEMTNALERFTSEYELYVQDISSGTLNTNDLDSAQGRVKNVIGATTRAEITALESATNYDGTAKKYNAADANTKLYRDTKYATDVTTMKAIVQNYTKTSSSTFEPKQSDCHFYYSPQCGLVVCHEAADVQTNGDKVLDALVVSGMDAKGNKIYDAATKSDTGCVDVIWFDLTDTTKSH